MRRIHARVTVHAPAVVEAGGAPKAYEVRNLSAGGALLVGEPLPDGSELGLEMQLGEGAPLALEAQVVRQAPEVGEPAFAVRFVGVTPELDGRLTAAVTESFTALGGRILGQVRSELQRRGITDVSKVADELQRLKEAQARAHLFSSDLFTESGSDATAAIVSGTTGEKKDCIVWSLNLYLGLNREPRVIERAREATARFGTGSGTSAPSGGLNAMHREIERRVAQMTGQQRALVFPTGYTANLGALSALPGPKDLVLLDREAHASMIDGVRLSGKKWVPFKHNDVADLADKLDRYGPHHENVFVCVESAYSMSGDLAPLREIAALKQTRRFFLFVDEAHTFGLYGEGGRGYCHHLGVSDDVDFVVSTFSKATASIGGFFAADEKYCTLLQATATPYIFQACLTPPDAATILASLEVMAEDGSFAARLHENNRVMRERLEAEGFDLGTSESPVIPVYVPDLEKLYRLCAELYADGIYSVPVVYPAVGVNEGRIRFIVNASHTRAQIDRTVAVLAERARALGILPARPEPAARAAG